MLEWEEIGLIVSQNCTASLKHLFQIIFFVLECSGLKICSEVLKTRICLFLRENTCRAVPLLEISFEKSLAPSDYFHAEFPLPPSHAIFLVGLFPTHQAFYSSCCWDWSLCAGFFPITLGLGFFSTLDIQRSLDLAFTWDVTLIFYLCSITLIAQALQAILPLSSY